MGRQHSNYYRGAGLRGLGQTQSPAPVQTVALAPAPSTSPMVYVWAPVAALSAGAMVYHGYKRNGSIGWAIGWGLLGLIFPIFTVPVALAQGFAKPRVRSNRTRRSRRRRNG